jgi:AsmA protein
LQVSKLKGHRLGGNRRRCVRQHSPRVQFVVNANDINVAEWEQIFKASGPAGPQTTPNVKPAAPQNPHPEEGLMSRVTGTGSLTADNVVYDQLQLRNVRSNVTLDHGMITVKPLTAGLYNGQETGTVVINTRSTPPTYTVDSKARAASKMFCTAG